MIEPSLERQLKVILKGVEEAIPIDELKDKIKRSIETQTPLRVKLGLDPSAPDIHLGHSVVLRKLRQFQDLGHLAVLIIGDFTGMVGDPTDRKETRKRLTEAEVRENANTYADQILKVLDPDRVEVVYNSDWLGRMSMPDILEMTSKYTVARMLERDDFAKRYADGQPISIVEFMYPLLQGTDSVHVRADVELGGTDQKFNLLVGRDLQKLAGQETQAVITMPLLEGMDGVQKMSKSLGNYIGLTEAPSEMFGKIMSIPDELIVKYYLLATDKDADDIGIIEKGLKDDSIHPGQEKRSLAKEVVALYYSVAEAEQAEAEFDRIFKDKDKPSDILEISVSPSPSPSPSPELEEKTYVPKIYIPQVIVDCGFAASNSDARRMIAQGGVKLDDETLNPDEFEIEATRLDSKILQVGKRHFVRLRLA